MAVVTSTNRIDHSGTVLISTAATAGATIIFAELITPYIELTRNSLPEGTSGMNDCTAGVCTPPPAERMNSTTKIMVRLAHPIAKLSDSTTVTTAITISGSIISNLRL